MSYNTLSRKRCYRLSTPVRLGVAAVAACFLAAPLLAAPPIPTTNLPTNLTNLVGIDAKNIVYSANSLDIVTSAARSAADVSNFNIAAGYRVGIVQPSASANVLFRVLSNDPSVIYGSLSSNGGVYLVNPGGIFVGPGGTVDVARFAASTLAISNADFLAGRNLFVNDGSAKDVINQGQITTPAGGSVYLIGSNVSNEGIITTPQGETILAAGATVSLIDSALPGVKVDITGATGNSTNLGTITAEAGRIGIAGVIVRNSGTLNASSVVSEGGRIFLKASQDAYVDGNGRIVTTGTKGGSVEVLGNRVAVMDNASIDASGTGDTNADGGRIMIGGDYQGKNPDIQNASITYFGPNASLKADAGKVGAGGTVIVWADDTTRAYGSISARGGASGGNGGFVETSGKRWLDVSGIEVSTAAPNGSIGTWLLDPTDITIVHSTSYGGATFPSDIFDNGGTDDATLNDYDINANLATSSITITTSSAGYGGGDITFDASAGAGGAIFIDNGSGAARTLTLVADNDIKFIGGGTTFRSTAASSPLTVNFNPASSGMVEVQSGASLTFNGFDASSVTTGMIINSAGTKTWENYGTINLSGHSVIDLHDGAYSTFNNNAGGVLNIGSSFTWSFLSESSNQNGPLNNAGTINVNTPTSWEARFSQGSGGILNINGSAALSMQHLDVAMGTINLNSAASYALTLLEQHTGLSKFDGASIVGVSGPKRMQIGTSGSTSNTTTFNNVSTSGGLEVLVPELGTLNFTGANTFADTKFFKGDSGANKHWVIPVATYTGTTQWWATGDISFAGNTTFGGAVTLGAGWNSNIATPVVTAGSGSILVSGGKQVLSSGDIHAFAGQSITLTDSTVSAAGTMNIETQSLTISAVTGPSRLMSQGNQTVTLGTGAANSSLQLTSTNGEARLSTYGSQTITFNGSAANTLQLQGSNNNTTYGGNAARIEAGGSQSITYGGGGLAITMYGGTGTATYGGSSYNDGVLVCATCATHNEAQISSVGNQTVNATSIAITGGGGGNGNWAGIESKSTSSVVASGAITITGGASGGAYFAGPDGYVSNDAGISADGALSVTAGSIVLAGGAAAYGGAYIGGSSSVTVNTTGNLTLTGGSTAAQGAALTYANASPATLKWLAPAIIGSDAGSLVNVTLNVGGDLTLTGGAMGQDGGSMAMVGGVKNTPVNLVINSNAITLNSANALADRIGSKAGGTISLHSGGIGSIALGDGLIGTGYGMGGSVLLDSTGTGGISQGVGGMIVTDWLNATATGSASINLDSFENRVGNVDATTSTGLITFKGQSVGLGTINSGTGGAIIAAYYDIHDNNGSAINISGPTVSLQSSLGGSAGYLAISADVAATTSIVAQVDGGAANGGIRIANSSAAQPGSVTLTDNASAGTSASFTQNFTGAGTLAATGSISLTALYGGDISLVSNDGLDFSSAIFNTTGGVGSIGLGASGLLAITSTLSVGNNDLLLAGSTVNIAAPVTTTADLLVAGSTVNINSTVSAVDIGLVAGSLTVGNTVGLLATNSLVAVVAGDVNINGGYIKTSAGDLEMLIGGDLNIGNASYGGEVWAGYNKLSPYFPDASIAVGGDINLINGGHINAANDVYLDLLGSTSTLAMTDGSYVMSDIGTQVVGTTHLSFLGRSTGGVVIDGIETTTTVVGGSGFFAVNLSTPATAGAGLQITYSATNQDLCAISPDLCKPPGTADTPIDEPPPSFEITGPGGTNPGDDPGKTAGGTEGSFGGDEDKDDEKDDEKDKKSDQANDGKKDDKPGQKKVANCSL